MNTQQKTAARRGSPSPVPDYLVRERAYEIYEQRGRKGSHAESDWLTAEAELTELKTKAASMLSTLEAPSGLHR